MGGKIFYSSCCRTLFFTLVDFIGRLITSLFRRRCLLVVYAVVFRVAHLYCFAFSCISLHLLYFCVDLFCINCIFVHIRLNAIYTANALLGTK